jgi:endonuclease/exonuclease/phosphatase family metal-dependent hydrolase
MKHLRAVLPLLCGSLLAGITPVHSQGTGNNAAELRVMSFNLRYGTARDGDNSWPQRRDLLVRVIREFAPDVLGTQEALRFQLDELREGVPGYTEIGVGRDDGIAAGEYAAILYRSDRFGLLDQGTFWLSDTPDVPGSATWGNSITRICTWARLADRRSGREFYVYNLHLDHQSQPSRERSVELLTSVVSSRRHPDPYVVLGDFNAGEGNPAMRYLRGEVVRAHDGSFDAPPPLGLRDTFRVLYPDQVDVGTFNGFDGTTTGEKIDAVLVSGEWEVTEAQIVRTAEGGRYPSDHFPVVATVAFNPSPPRTPEP